MVVYTVSPIIHRSIKMERARSFRRPQDTGDVAR